MFTVSIYQHNSNCAVEIIVDCQLSTSKIKERVSRASREGLR